ncbi:hypothetical protein [Enterococcus sp. LJL90]
MKEKKNNQRTFRYSDTTKKYLETYEGNGLNEKLENLVKQSFIEKPNLMQQIEEKKRTLNNLEKKVQAKQELLYTLDNIERQLKNILITLK